MENQTQTNQSAERRQNQGLTANPQVYFDVDQGTITHRLGNDMRIVLPVNFYRKTLGIPFEPKAAAGEKPARQSALGLIARVGLYMSKDGNYLIHSVLGVRIVKHVNYYKRILEEYTAREAHIEKSIGKDSALGQPIS